MNVVKRLEELRNEINPEIEKYFRKIIVETEAVDPDIARAMKYVRKIMLGGGKRARAIFMYYGYLAAGGREREKIIRASISIEFIHSFLLIHDDIIDQDEKRHGVTTVHKHYEKLGKLFLGNRDPRHFGSSMAIIIGDMIAALGNQIIFESEFEPEKIIKALIKLQRIISYTVIGESEDVYIENRGRASEKEILRMYENKTAKYTIEGPLHLGSILAGAEDEFLKMLTKYSVPTGIAFQIQDDILGIFGNEKKLGKPVGSDIRQGKQTILVARALAKANSKQRAGLKSVFGKKDLSANDLENFRKIIVDTGSLAYAQKMAIDLVAKGRAALSDRNLRVKMHKEAKEFLLGMGDYIINRSI